mmetsp:Transcript_41754/g.79933  ORF Transcript_41754/g.79933 Transcript_41754/m.79933 type:complete len:136 (+) Transcript_41754:3-410(+)
MGTHIAEPLHAPGLHAENAVGHGIIEATQARCSACMHHAAERAKKTLGTCCSLPHKLTVYHRNKRHLLSQKLYSHNRCCCMALWAMTVHSSPDVSSAGLHSATNCVSTALTAEHLKLLLYEHTCILVLCIRPAHH